MFIWRGFLRETEVAVEDRGCGAGEIACAECDGDWLKFHPELERHPEGFPYPMQRERYEPLKWRLLRASDARSPRVPETAPRAS